MPVAWIYVGAVYGLAVFLTRRAGVDLPVRTAAVLFAVAAGALFPSLVLDRPGTSHDVLGTIPPWSAVHAVGEPLNGELNDVPLQHVPWAHQVRQSWKRLQPPLWNPNAGCGYPLLANGQSSALSPLRILALPLPLSQALAAEAAMKLLVAMTFTFLFCRRRGYAPAASLVGAVIFGLSGFLHAWLYFPHSTAACFLPAVLLLVDLLAERVTRARFALATGAWVCIILAGHPETAAHIFLLACLYTAWVIAVERRTGWRRVLTLAGALSMAALLSAPLLLPFLEALPKSQRYQSLKGKPYTPSAIGYRDAHSLSVMLVPRFFGKAPVEETWQPVETEMVSGFAGMLGIASWFAVALDVVRRRRWRSTEAFLAGAALLAFGVFMSWPILGEAVHLLLPVVAHARMRLVFTAVLAVLAAAAMDLALRGESRPLVAGGLVAAVPLACVAMLTTYPDARARTVALLALVPALAVLASAVAFAVRPSRALVALVFAAAVFEMGPVSAGWNPPLDRQLLYPATPLTRRLDEFRAQQPATAPFRIAGMGASLYPNAAAMYGYEDVRVNDPMANARYLDFLSLTAGYDPWTYHPSLKDPNASVFDFLNVRYLLLEPGVVAWPDGERWTGLYNGPDGRIFENRRFLPRFYAVRNVILDFDKRSFTRRLVTMRDWNDTALLDSLEPESPRMRDDFFLPRPADAPEAVATIVSASPTEYRVHVTAPRWSLVVSSIPWWPGWKVERNGERIKPIRVNGAFVGFAVPRGESEVRIVYSPWTWWVGWIVALLTFARVRDLNPRRNASPGSPS